MAKKVTAWKPKGMNRDLSVSAFKPEFAFENMNLRLSTNEGNTLMSWVTERGPKRIKEVGGIDLSLEGTPIGTAVLNKQLIIFTKSSASAALLAPPDYIYLLEFNDTRTFLQKTVLYNGNLNFNTNYPLETIAYYCQPPIFIYFELVLLEFPCFSNS